MFFWNIVSQKSFIFIHNVKKLRPLLRPQSSTYFIIIIIRYGPYENGEAKPTLLVCEKFFPFPVYVFFTDLNT